MKTVSIIRALSGVLMAFTLFAATTVNAAIYMKIPDIEGESRDHKHKDWIVIQSFSFGATNSGSGGGGGGGGAGRTTVTDLAAQKSIDKATPKLFLACCNGQHIPTVKLELTRTLPRKPRQPAEEQTYMQIELENVLISSYQTGGSGSEVPPTDNFSLNFSRIKITYFYTDDSGAQQEISAGWNVDENTQF